MVSYNTKNKPYETEMVSYDTKSKPYETKMVSYDTKNKPYETKMVSYDTGRNLMKLIQYRTIPKRNRTIQNK